VVFASVSLSDFGVTQACGLLLVARDPPGPAVERAIAWSLRYSAAFAPRGSPRGFCQAHTLVSVIGHAQVGALVT
jgi:hypothetical protein